MPIVAGVDRSERTERVVRQSRELADAYETVVHVVHVGEADVSRVPEGANIGTLDETPGIEDLDQSALPQGEIREARERAHGVAQDAIERHEIDDGEAVGLVGDPAARLLEYAEEVDAEYIVVSARKRSRVGKVLFGSVTQSLLLNADRPIVAVGENPN